MNKKTLRNQLLKIRNNISSTKQQHAAIASCDAVVNLKFFQEATDIAFYLAHKNETDPKFILQAALRLNKHCYLPIISTAEEKVKHDSSNLTRKLSFSPYKQNTKLEANEFGILEPQMPTTEHLFPVKRLSLIFLPLVGFDLQGNRLGMGLGYYDATLTKLDSRERPLLIGLAYASQQVTQIPSDPWDIPLDGVLTEEGYINITSCK